HPVQTLALRGTGRSAGGDCLSIGGQSRSRAAALNTTTGLATAWDPVAFGSVGVIAPGPHGKVFVGGSFNGIGGVPRANAAAVDVRTGAPPAWAPATDTTVQALLVTPDRVFVGGLFTRLNGSPSASLAAVNRTTGATLPWSTSVTGSVAALALQGDQVCVGGLFTALGGQARANLGAVDVTTGLAKPWSADASDQVFALESSNGVVRVGGNFLTLGGLSRPYLGALDATTGAVTAWAPSPNAQVRAIATVCDQVYLGGTFTNIAGTPRNRVAAVSATSGAPRAWNPNANGSVFAVVPRPGALYLGGVMTTVGGVARNRVASVDPATGALNAWNPNSNGTVRALSADADHVYIGGLFSSVAGQPTGGLSAVTSDPAATCATLTLTPATLPNATLGSTYSQTLSVIGGTAPSCWTWVSGTLPSGLTFDPTTGTIAGTPSSSGTSVVTVMARDARGCTGTTTFTLQVAAPLTPQGTVVMTTTGLCLNPEVATVSVPFTLSRLVTLAARRVVVSFALDTTRLALATPGDVAANFTLGDWGASFTNRSLVVTELGAGRYSVDVSLGTGACGVRDSGRLFEVALGARATTGNGSLALVSATAEGCSGISGDLLKGADGSILVPGNTVTIAPSTLAQAVAGEPYSTTFSALGATSPVTWSLASGALPPGLTLSGTGVLSGTPTLGGTFGFAVRATEPSGCRTTRSLTLEVVCPAISLTPAYLPDGAVGTPYSMTLRTSGGVAPFAFAVTSGDLPAGHVLAPSGTLSGTPTTAGTSILTVTVTDANGCTGSIDHLVDIYPTMPPSTIQASAGGRSLSSARSVVSVPITYTRGESDSVRMVSVSFQTDPTCLSLAGPTGSAFRLGDWAPDGSDPLLQVTADGNGAWTVDIVLLNGACGLTTGGTLFTVDLVSAGPEGSVPFTVTRVKARDCSNQPIPVRSGLTDSLRVQFTDLLLQPATLPGAVAGSAYAETLVVTNGIAPVAFRVASGALPTGLTLTSGGLLSGTPTTPGTYGFTISAADADSIPGQRAFQVAVVPGAPSSLVFATQPSMVTAGQPILPAVRVSVQDALGNPIPGTTVVLNSIGPGTLLGTTSVSTDTLGIAAFNSLRIEVSGAHSLEAVVGALSATSDTFRVQPALPTTLTFTTEPSSALAGVAIAPAVTVRAADAFGNPVPGLAVTLAANGPG
ncbi:MAG: putative Ig domain-containing protein, partial [bacterium]